VGAARYSACPCHIVVRELQRADRVGQGQRSRQRHDPSSSSRLAAQLGARSAGGGASGRADGNKRRQHEPGQHGERRRHGHDGDHHRIGNDRAGGDEHDIRHDGVVDDRRRNRIGSRGSGIARAARRGGGTIGHERDRDGRAGTGAQSGRHFLGLIAAATAEPRAALAGLPERRCRRRGADGRQCLVRSLNREQRRK
jgi:hypothetical protein